MEFLAMGVLSAVGVGAYVAIKKSKVTNQTGRPSTGIPMPDGRSYGVTERKLTSEEAYDLRNNTLPDSIDYISKDTLSPGRWIVAFKDGTYTYANKDGLPRVFIL